MEPTTPNQCGENPAYLMNVFLCLLNSIQLLQSCHQCLHVLVLKVIGVCDMCHAPGLIKESL